MALLVARTIPPRFDTSVGRLSASLGDAGAFWEVRSKRDAGGRNVARAALAMQAAARASRANHMQRFDIALQVRPVLHAGAAMRHRPPELPSALQ